MYNFDSFCFKFISKILSKHRKLIYKILIPFALIFYLLIFSNKPLYSQLTVSGSVTTNAQALNLVQNVLVQTGVTISNVTWSGRFAGAKAQIGQFTYKNNGAAVNLGIPKGIIMSNGNIYDAANKQSYNGWDGTRWWTMCLAAGGNNCQDRDADLENLVDTINNKTIWPACNACTYDAAILEFDFIPLSSIVKFNYVFGSVEYPDYVCGPYSDVFGFFVTGPNPTGAAYNNTNVALIPGTKLPVAIGTINSGSPGADSTITPPIPYSPAGCKSLAYKQYYRNNSGDPYIVYNGLTTVLTAEFKVVPCKHYHIKLAIADVGDDAYDSSVFLDAFSSPIATISVAYQKSNLDATAAIKCCSDAIIKITLPAPATKDTVIHYNFAGSGIYGSDYTTIPAGKNDSITVLANQDTVSFHIHPLCPSVTPGNLTAVFNLLGCGNTILTTDTVNIKDNTLVTVTKSKDTTICPGQFANISVSSKGGLGDYRYYWSSKPAGFKTPANTDSTIVTSPADTTIYYVTAKDTCQSSDTTSIKVNVNIVNAQAKAMSATSFCMNDSVILDANLGKGFKYQWQLNSVSLKNDTDSVYVASKAGKYSVVVTNITNCSKTSDTITVTISKPDAILTSIGNTSFCTGGSVTLNVSPNGYIYQWIDNGDSIKGANTNTYTANTSGLYSVFISDGKFCQDTSNVISVTVVPNPSVVIVPWGPFYICEDSTISVTVQTNTGVFYQWSDNGSSISGATNNTLTFNSKGNYSVIVSDSLGCKSTDTVSVDIKCYSMTLYAPSGFTPDQTQTDNTIFLPKGKNIVKYALDVYNRLGLLIFHSDDINVGWDGTFKGSPCPQGVYVYIISYEGYVFNQYLKKTKTGPIALIR